MLGALRNRMWLGACLLMYSSLIFGQQDYQEWLRNQEQGFHDFKDARDKAFIDFLNSEWQKYTIMQGLQQDQRPKPDNAPSALTVPDLEILPFAPLKLPPPPAVEMSHENMPLQPNLCDGILIKYSFFDHPVIISVDSSFMCFNMQPRPQTESIAAFWQFFSGSNYSSILTQLNNLREDLALNDWGYYWLIRKMVQQIWPEQTDKSTLFTWFLINKSGYDARIGFNIDNIYLLLAASPTLYNRPYLVLDGKKYYLCNETISDKIPENLQTYQSSYPNADKPLDLQLKHPPQLGNTVTEIKLNVPDEDSSFSVRININPSLIAFYRDYPQTDLSVYFKSPITQQVMVQLAKALLPKLLCRSMPGALNLLLHFVQTSFSYKTDKQQFGHEKPLFPEETLYYPASDCEDRSVLFAHLAKQLLGVDIVGLDYPGHVATAVHSPEMGDVQGDSVIIDNKKYLICDPTYLNASIGQLMPQYQHARPEMVRM